MPNTGGVNRSHNSSTIQKLIFAGLHFAILLICIWLLFYNGWHEIGLLLNRNWVLTNPNRGSVLLFCATLYWLRHLITLFYLLARTVEWREVFGLLLFITMFDISLMLIGAGAFGPTSPLLNGLDIAGLILLVIGSYINSGSEIQRKLWKRNPATKGHCYTEGLFRHSMHINYFGDIILFTGWTLLTTSIWTLVLPVFMAYLFVTLHIPGLDVYLAKRYGAEFRNYAAKTKKLIPYIY